MKRYSNLKSCFFNGKLMNTSKTGITVCSTIKLILRMQLIKAIAGTRRDILPASRENYLKGIFHKSGQKNYIMTPIDSEKKIFELKFEQSL